MKLITITLLAFLMIACRVEKTGEDTYRVETPTATSDTATQTTTEAGERTDTTADNLRREGSEALQATETAAREAVRQTGTALEKAGEELQKRSKPGDQE